MNVIVDTSVWSLALRRGTPSHEPEVRKLAEMIEQGRPILLLGVVLQEVLQGIRKKADFAMVKSQLESIPMLALDRDDYVFAAELRDRCVASGVQASTIDSQIAAACIRHDCRLLSCDKDFQHIARCCPLELL